MIEPSQITACVYDYGTFLDLASRLGETYKRVLYYSPHETEYQDAKLCVIGTGIPTVERCDDPLDYVDEIDLHIFPDIAMGGLQRHLRSMGKPVWGSFGGTDLELYRTRFQKMLADVGLPIANTRKVVGLNALEEIMRKEKDKWIKLNRFRANYETFHHIDWEHSVPDMLHLRQEFGGVSEKVVFVVQDPIPDAQEVGYDGYCIDGKYPAKSFQGYELKNKLYLGSWLPADELPDMVQEVNEAIGPVLKKIGYRNFLATEIRDSFFIDITPRHAGQTQEHLQRTCTNLPEIIAAGAEGEMVEPEFEAKFAAEATLHYTGCGDAWRILRVSEEAKENVRLTSYCQDGDVYHFPPGKNDEVGVVIGNGNTVQEAIDDLKENYELLKEEPVKAEISGFVDILKDIEKAQADGIKFSTKPIPKPESVVK